MLTNIIFSRIILRCSYSIGMTRCAGWTACCRDPRVRGHLGTPPGRQVAPAHRVVAAARRPLRRSRSVRPAGVAALSGRGGRRALPRLRRCRVPGLALVPGAAVRGGRADRLAGALRARRAALPPCRGPHPGRRPAELAGPPGAAADAGRLRVEPAHDARRDPRRRRSPVRPGRRSLCGASLAPRASRRCLPVRRSRRSGLHIHAVGRDASLLGAGRTLRG